MNVGFSSDVDMGGLVTVPTRAVMADDSGDEAIQVGDFDRVQATPDPRRYVEWMDRQRALGADRALDKLRLAADGAVLDVGCGPGVDLDALASRTRLAVGIDLADAMVRQAHIRVPTASVAVADGCHLPFTSNAFNAGWMRAVLVHSADPQSVVKEIGRVLRPGSMLVLSEPDHGSHVVGTDYPEIFERIKAHRRSKFKNPYAGRNLAAVATAVGFDISRIWVTPILHTSFEQARAAGGPFDRAVADAVSDGIITPDEADRYVGSLQERDRDGAFVFAGLAVSVSAFAA